MNRLTSSNKSDTLSSNQKQTKSRLKNFWNTLKDQILPKSKAERAKRLGQLRDMSIFFVSVGSFMFFEKKLRKMISINQNEILKMSMAQGSMSQPY